MRDEFEARQRFVVERLNELPGFHCQPGDGSFYAFPNVSDAIDALGVSDDIELCEQLLTEAGVAVVPGTAFSAPGHLRLSFAADRKTLTNALDRIGSFLEAH